ncbi:MAG: hypothetical protein PVI90_19940, partial [Desulfobacteraceae bacterium]
MDIEQLYHNLPIFMQNIICSIEGYRLKRRRYNQKYYQIYRQLKKNPFISREKLRELRKKRLVNFLLSARSSSFWLNQLPAEKSLLEDPFAALSKLPILTKLEVKKNIKAIINDTSKNIITSHTSGTTGSGLVFPILKTSEIEQFAVWRRYWESHNILSHFWCGYFGGRSVVSIHQTTPPYWRVNYPGKQLLFSGYHLSEATAKNYIDALNEFQPIWLHGYPSILSLLSKHILEQGLLLKYKPKVITIGAESLHAHQKQIIKKAFSCPVRQHYGLAEGVANISECENGNLHVDEDFSFVEFEPTGIDKFTYKIIGTNWSNPAFPLLRYDTGDTVVVNNGKCNCGRNGRIVELIYGRMEDYITLPNGFKIGRLDHIFKDITDVIESQIYQPDKNKIIFKIVKGANYDSNTEKTILEQARKRIGKEIKIDFAYQEKIMRTSRGKLKFVVS